MKYSVETWQRAVSECLHGRNVDDGTIIWITPPLLEILQTGTFFDKNNGTFNGFECFKWPENVAGYDKPNFWIMNKNI